MAAVSQPLPWGCRIQDNLTIMSGLVNWMFFLSFCLCLSLSSRSFIIHGLGELLTIMLEAFQGFKDGTYPSSWGWGCRNSHNLILLVKGSHKASPNSRNRETQFTFWLEELQLNVWSLFYLPHWANENLYQNYTSKYQLRLHEESK